MEMNQIQQEECKSCRVHVPHNTTTAVYPLIPLFSRFCVYLPAQQPAEYTRHVYHIFHTMTEKRQEKRQKQTETVKRKKDLAQGGTVGRIIQFDARWGDVVGKVKTINGLQHVGQSLIDSAP